MYTAFFIAHRIRKANKKAFTTLVQRIGTVSVALGLSSLLLAFLVISGFQHDVEEKLTSFQGQFQIFKYSLSHSLEEPPISVAKVEGIQQAFANHIQHIQAFAHKVVLVQTKDNLEGIVLKGIDLQHTYPQINQYLAAGAFMSSNDPKYAQEIVLSTVSASKLNVQIGDEVTICIFQQTPRYRKLKVVGLYNTYIEEIDDKVALCDIRLLQYLNNWTPDLVGGYDVFTHTKQPNWSLGDELLDWLGYDLDIKSIRQAYPAIFDWLTIMKKDILVFLTLILLVANSNIICIVLIQIMERTNMIGLLKSMGATDGLIYKVLLWNNIRLILKGMFWGNLIGLGLATLEHHFKFIKLDPTYYHTTYIPIAWNLKTILFLNLTLFGLVSLVLLISIGIIAKIRPISTIQLR